MAAARRSRSAGLAARLAGKRVLVCVGAGGVGKTTTSAALALGLAREGKKVAVVTIDPAKRLASALGLQRLSSEPSRIDPAALRGAGVHGRGELWAMMLDTKRTFDEVVMRLASDDERPRGDPRQPDLPGALHRRGGVAGAERRRQAVRALRGTRLRGDRARHPAVAQRARLPGGAGAAAGLLRRPGAAGVPRPQRAHRAAVRARHGARVLDLRPRHGREHAQRTVELLPHHVERDRRASASARARWRRCCGRPRPRS